MRFEVIFNRKVNWAVNRIFVKKKFAKIYRPKWHTFWQTSSGLYTVAWAHFMPIVGTHPFQIRFIVELDGVLLETCWAFRVLPSQISYLKLPETHFCKGTELEDPTHY